MFLNMDIECFVCARMREPRLIQDQVRVAVEAVSARIQTRSQRVEGRLWRRVEENVERTEARDRRRIEALGRRSGRIPV